LMLDQIPPICAFHLKRFKNDGSWVEKLDKHVDFPLEKTCSYIFVAVRLKMSLDHRNKLVIVMDAAFRMEYLHSKKYRSF
nr:ubiquitin carboxyl-terminal hydrolase 20-like [Tanacetum cinerariifolium]